MAKIIEGKNYSVCMLMATKSICPAQLLFLLQGPYNHPQAFRRLWKLHLSLLLPSILPSKPVPVPILPVRLNGIFILPVVLARNRVLVPSLSSQIQSVVMFGHFSLKSSGICPPFSSPYLDPRPGSSYFPSTLPPDGLPVLVLIL